MQTITGSAKIDVLIYSDDPFAIEQGMDPIAHGIEVFARDLVQDKEDPTVFRGVCKSPACNITVRVNPDGSTDISTVPSSEIFENTLRLVFV